MTRKIAVLALFWCVIGLAGTGFAQGNYARIARLSYLDGNVSFQHSDDADWSAASINMPLQEGDRIYTGPQGRAEIQFDEGSVFRLAENTDMEILSLEDNLIQLRVLLGLSTLTVSSSLDFETGTPAAAFNTLSKGVYRFDVIESGSTDGIVRSGSMEAANDQFSRRLRSGELIHITPGEGVQTVSRYLSRDAWDEWNDRRTADLRASTSAKYLPDYVYIGASDLDRNGRWVTVDGYGAAWVPFYLTAEWTPYSIGRWCYRPFWGWTWVSYEPWGWLPYHYGRWHHSTRFGWCWLPGAAISFNFWSPALVSFYQGPGWVSWCPLGPGDYYNVNHYFYRKSFQRQLNDVRMLQRRPPGDLANRSIPGAFRTAPADRFVNGSFGTRETRTPDLSIDRPWEKGRLINDQPDIKPTAGSFAPAPGRGISRPASKTILPTVVRSEPAVGMRERMTRISNPRVQPTVRESGMPRIEGATSSESAPNANRGPRPGDAAAPGVRQPQGTPGQVENPRPGGINRSPQESQGSATTPRGQVPQAPTASPGTPSTSERQRTAPARNTEVQRNPERRRQATPVEGIYPGGRQPQGTPGQVENPRPGGINRSPQQDQGSATTPRDPVSQPSQANPATPSTSVPQRNTPARDTEMQRNPERRQQAAPTDGGAVRPGPPATRASQPTQPSPRQERVTPVPPINRTPAPDANKPNSQETPNPEKARQPQEQRQVNSFSSGSGYAGLEGTRAPRYQPTPAGIGRQQPSLANIEPSRGGGAAAQGFWGVSRSGAGSRAEPSRNSAPSASGPRDRKGK